MNKIFKMIIGTHSGRFHCDEVLACVILKSIPEFSSANIERSRNHELINKSDIVVDVGGIYDHATKRYDHHQGTFNLSAKDIDSSIDSSIKLSSAGLIYLHYGKKSIANVLSLDEKSDLIKLIHRKLYFKFIMEIDAIDNGINAADEMKYKISTDLSSRVGRLNPEWNIENADENEYFFKAFDLVDQEYRSRLMHYKNVWLPAREIVEKSFSDRFNFHPEGKAFLLTKSCPWEDHIRDIEIELGLKDEQKPLYVVYERNDKSWSIQGVHINENSFLVRFDPPKSWLGTRDEQLSKLAGVPDCVFCHSTGFLMINKTKDGIVKLLNECLKNGKNNLS